MATTFTTRFATTNRIENTNTLLLNGAAVVVGVIGQWANGSTFVNRAAGSWNVDGVKAWSLVSGNLATRFPAGTRVAVVSPLTLIMSNAATAAGAGTDSATFTPSFAIDEDPAYPLSNLQYPGRQVAYHCPQALGSPTTIEYDLGSNKTMLVMAGLAAEALDQSALGPSTIALRTGTVYGAYTLRATANATAAKPYRDAGVVFAQVNERFLKFEIASDGPYMIGSLWVGVFDLDVGVAWWPGSGFRHEINESRVFSGDMTQSNFNRGAPKRLFKLDFNGVPDAIRDGFFSLFATATRPPIMADKDDNVWEVILSDSAYEWSAKFFNNHVVPLSIETLR